MNSSSSTPAASVERGVHDELLARGGIYASLWAHQSGGFLPTMEAAELVE
jgi:hypothetical protein